MPTMPVQDDSRENQMVDRFNLSVIEDRKRADIDAYLMLNGTRVEFELKSTTGKSVATVRDFGPAHIAKWEKIHWLFGVYDREGKRLLYTHYASPEDMRPWITERAEYVRPDVTMAPYAPLGISEASVIELLGEKPFYSVEDAKWIMKLQWSAERYRDASDVEHGRTRGYSLGRMVEIMRERCLYVMARGATLNNPHISLSYIAQLPRIESEPAATLRKLVGDYLEKASATEEATE